MKNINILNGAIMAGRNWCATPFVINYGHPNHGYEDEYMDYEYVQSKKDYVYFNIFGMTKKAMGALIKKLANPKSFALSIGAGDFRDALYGASVKERNTIHILLEGKTIRIACSWLHDSKSASTANLPDEDDFMLMYEHTYEDADFPFMLITSDYPLFKFTVEMYKLGLHLRLLSECVRTELVKAVPDQYAGWLRVDEGKDVVTRRCEAFSSLKTYPLNEALAMRVVEVMRGLQIEYEQAEEAVTV